MASAQIHASGMSPQIASPSSKSRLLRSVVRSAKALGVHRLDDIVARRRDHDRGARQSQRRRRRPSLRQSEDERIDVRDTHDCGESVETRVPQIFRARFVRTRITMKAREKSNAARISSGFFTADPRRGSTNAAPSRRATAHPTRPPSTAKAPNAGASITASPRLKNVVRTSSRAYITAEAMRMLPA